MSVDVDLAVVGAGLSGLVAARNAQRAGLRVVVIEARNRPGGRIWSRSIHGGEMIEMGGQYLGPTQDRILALAAELGVETFPCYDEGDRFVSIGGRRDVALGLIEDTVEKLERMAAELPLGAPWAAERAREWDAQTLRTWMQAHLPDPTGQALLRFVVRAIFTAEADELSLLHVLAYIRSAGSLTLLTQTRGGAQEWRIVGGSQVIADRLVDSLGADSVRLGCPVRRIVQSGEIVTVEAEGAPLRARKAVVAVPIPLADRIAYSPALPGYRSQLHQRMSPGATVKINCVYPEPFWRAAGHSGRSLTDEGFVSVTFDNCPASGTPGVLVAFIEADAARQFARLSAGARRSAVLDHLVRVFGPRAAEPLEYLEQDWSDEEWTRGCYGANFGPGGWTRYGQVLREPFGHLYWAGAETSPIWMNYMDGAVRSGERAAAEVVNALASSGVTGVRGVRG
ncbi:flavin monoamine oxidase family protein [Micromonosporaceae bacterium B7E4]